MPASNWTICKPMEYIGTAKGVKAAYAEGKDFRTLGISAARGSYVSRREVERYGLTLEVRFGRNLEKVTVLK